MAAAPRAVPARIHLEESSSRFRHKQADSDTTRTCDGQALTTTGPSTRVDTKARDRGHTASQCPGPAAGSLDQVPVDYTAAPRLRPDSAPRAGPAREAHAGFRACTRGPGPGRRTADHVPYTGRPGAGDQRAQRSGHRPLDFMLDSDWTGGPTQRGAPRSPRQPEDPEPGSTSSLGPDSDGTHQADGLPATNSTRLLPVQTPTQVPPATTRPPRGRDQHPSVSSPTRREDNPPGPRTSTDPRPAVTTQQQACNSR